MPEYNAEWPDFTDYCKRLLDAKNKDGVFPAFGRVGGLEPSMLDTLDACLRAIVYTTKNKGELPPAVWIRTKGTSTPTPTPTDCYQSKRYLTDVNLKQDTNYFCACNIFQQIMYELYGILISESDIARAMGTTTDGTGHEGIINGGKAIAKQYGHSVSIEFKNYSSMTEKEIGELIANPDVGVFIHDLYKLTWGHYEYLIGLCLSSGVYTVANSLSGGYIEQRSRATMKSYINGISQPSVGIVRKIS